MKLILLALALTGSTLTPAAPPLPEPTLAERWEASYPARIADSGADEDDIAAADERLMEFIRGTASGVDEQDLQIGTPAIVERAYLRLD
jgi:hypothetical protein